jgi:glycosyltransferase involved in cell wall biosynthesis
MKILYVITSTTTGGAEKILLSLLENIDKRKVTPVGVISLKPLGKIGKKIKKLGIEVISFDSGYIPSPGQIGRLKREIERLKPDAVHAFLYRAIQFCRLVKRDLNFPLISSPHMNYVGRNFLFNFIDRKLSRLDDLVICESFSSAHFLTDYQKYPCSRIRVVYNAIDTDKWSFSKVLRDEKRKFLELSQDDRLILSVGRLHYEKGHKYLLRAFKKIKDRFSNAKLAIVGDGPQKNSLTKMAKNLDLGNDVIMPGEDCDILPWLCACDVFALPSLWEGMPASLLEAMSVGCVCIASNVYGIKEVISNGEDGFLCSPKKINSWVNALSKSIKDGDLQKTLGKKAREKALSSFSHGNMIDRYLAEYADFFSQR